MYGGQRRYILECLDQLIKVFKCGLVNNLLNITDFAILFYSSTLSVQRILNHHIADVYILSIYGVAQKMYTLFTHQYLWNKFK
jgi:hypothetical protein